MSHRHRGDVKRLFPETPETCTLSCAGRDRAGGGTRRPARIVPRVPPVPRRDWVPPSRRRVLTLRDRLRLVYGRPSAPPHGQPLDELILTVLSQSTNDRNRDVAFLRLRDRFGS